MLYFQKDTVKLVQNHLAYLDISGPEKSIKLHGRIRQVMAESQPKMPEKASSYGRRYCSQNPALPVVDKRLLV